MKLANLARTLLRPAAVAAIALSVAGCAGTPATGPQDNTVSDPLEVPNRFIFAANDAADTLVIRPAAEIYTGAVPDPIRQIIHNFIQNLMAPLYIANNLLQGDFEGARTETGRFFANTILGVGGIADVASDAGIKEQQEDFGQTLAVWGVGPGPYIVLPLLGPSNLRDTVGYGVDTVADPFRLWAYGTDHKALTVDRAVAGGIDRRSELLGTVDDLKRNSLDYYATVRSLYAQQRNAAIHDNAPNAHPEFPEFPENAPPPKP